MIDILTQTQAPEFVKTIRNATNKALKGKVSEDDIHKLLSSMGEETTEAGMLKGIHVPSPAEATAELYTIAVYGYVKCSPTHLPYYFEANHWGIGLAAMRCYGFMYTAYENWDALFNETRGYHAQGIAEAGGILQITWFNGKHQPVGQFNAAAGGIGVFEVGGSGRWHKK
jgi:hypothetical protein